MVALVDDEGILRDRFRVNLVGVQEVDEFGPGGCSGGCGNEADVVCSSTRSDLEKEVGQAQRAIEQTLGTHPL